MDKKIKRIVTRNLNKIYSQSVKISKSFNQMAISPVILEDVIKINKMEKTDENKQFHDFIDKYNDMLDTLYKNCATYMKRINADMISFQYLKLAVLTLKKEIFNLPK